MSATEPATLPAPQTDATATPKTAQQFVRFAFYKLDPAWRALPEEEKAAGRADLVRIVEAHAQRMIVRTYSTAATRSDCDFLVWQVSYDMNDLQSMAADINRSHVGPYLTLAQSYLSMTKRSVYVDKHVHPDQEGRRSVIRPTDRRYFFVYPFVKTRQWYRLPLKERQAMMDVHIQVGHRYPSVKLNTTYSFGLDDQEFVVAFETDKPEDFLELVMELRDAESSLYTLRDTPIYTCIQMPLMEALEALG